MENMQNSDIQARTDELAKKVYDLLKLHGKLTEAEQKRDISKWGYSNPVATKFPDVENATAFLRQFGELAGLNLNPGQFTCFADATMFTVELSIKP